MPPDITEAIIHTLFFITGMLFGAILCSVIHRNLYYYRETSKGKLPNIPEHRRFDDNKPSELSLELVEKQIRKFQSDLSNMTAQFDSNRRLAQPIKADSNNNIPHTSYDHHTTTKKDN
jgi:hypothetical protein